jgi:hypothetical protein
MFTQYHKTQLKDLVRPKIGDFYQGTVNIRLNELIDNLHEQYPEFFHQDANSLRKRVFFDEPARVPGHAPIPMAGFIKPAEGWVNE